MEAWRLKMEPWRVYITVVADSYHFDEEQDPDPQEAGVKNIRGETAPDRHVTQVYKILMEKDMVKIDSCFCPVNNVERSTRSPADPLL
jgi:hypothetical protein